MTSTVTGRGPSVPPSGRRSEPRPTRSGVGWLLELPANAVRSVARSAKATPGRLSLIATGLIVLALVTGLVGTASVLNRDNTINALIDHREPLAAAAQEVYGSLSDADATAASAFLSTGTEPPELRERYELDIARAGAALAKAASDSGTVPEAAEQVAILSQRMPVYTGLIETARANNRQGFPSGAAYLREASELMRSQLLPAAHRLYEIDAQRLVDEQDTASGVPWLTAVLVFGLLAALIAAQIHLKRRTNRVFNIGLLVASIAVGLSILWGAGALTVQSVLVSSGRSTGTEQADLLVRARIAALQARADETLTLVARGGGESYDKEFGELFGQFAGEDGQGGLLGEARRGAEGGPETTHIASAANHATTWLRAHAEVRRLDNTGNYAEAVGLAIDGTNEKGAAAAFGRVDGDLVSAIGVARQSFLDETTNGSRALTLLAPGFAVLAAIAALGTTLGFRERLREYR
ncbi:hypothetical protein ABZ639_16915 [Saccharomonospora sp. NPDC006951]